MGDHPKLSTLYFILVCMMSFLYLKSKLTGVLEPYLVLSLKAFGPSVSFGGFGRIVIHNSNNLLNNPLAAKFIFAYSSVYRNHTSKLWKQLRLIQFIDDRNSQDDDVNKSSSMSSTRFSSKAVMTSYLVINLYLMALDEGFVVLRILLSKVAQPLLDPICAALVCIGCLYLLNLLRKFFGLVSLTTSDHSQSTETPTASSSQQSAGKCVLSTQSKMSRIKIENWFSLKAR